MNKVFLIGCVCNLKFYHKGDKTIINFSLALNETRSIESKTQFINCVAFGKTAELIEKYINKGYTLPIVGKLDVSSYKDDKGKMQTSTKVIVEEINFITNKKGDEKPKEENKSDGFINIDNSEMPVWMSEC